MKFNEQTNNIVNKMNNENRNSNVNTTRRWATENNTRRPKSKQTKYKNKQLKYKLHFELQSNLVFRLENEKLFVKNEGT